MAGTEALPQPPPGARMLPADAFSGQVAFVTGGGAGLGLAMALEFARGGATVAFSSRDPARRERACRGIEALGAQAIAVELDVRKAEAVDAAFATIAERAGPPDILVNNAAANFFSAARDITPNGWSAVIDRVLTGTFLCSRAFAATRTPGQGGSILNIGAPTALSGGPGVAHSAAAKAGVISLTQSLAVEWARDGIRVNCVVPGIVPHADDDPATQAGRVHFGDDAGQRVVAGRTGTPQEIAWLAAFLCSPFAAFITGQSVVIDGGDSLRRWIRQPPFVPIQEQLAELHDGN
jgi:NAD(P)-dependent dehydrogenase (short-subunit alcohol dehydrogenase family)